MNSIQTRRSSRAAALVIVLALLVILLGLIVTFLGRTTIERNASAGFAAASNTRQLGDTAVSLVQGQIRDATTLGQNVAWASQPGMIRTFAGDTGGAFSAGSSPLRAYKLYSSDAMIVSSANPTSSDQPPASWASDKAVWTDLNAPVTANGTANYPILDPGALGTVEGFSVTGAPTQGTTNTIPMPVRWLYVLKDGTIIAPTGSGTTATVTGAGTGDKAIVGRIAFWTDDETSKLNVNTASEGTMWDAPRTTTSQEKTMAQNQPAKNEYQRYSGHPAMTSLAPVLFATSATSTPVLSDAQREAIYSITPRVVGGGSNAGAAMGNASLTPDSDRLYATVDELIFSAARSSQVAAAGLTKAKLDSSRFFLTATSRAPEVTLFNTPRISMWPLENVPDNNTTHRTALDRLFAFVSTLNRSSPLPQKYYFQRSDPRSATADYTNIQRNQELYAYLKALTGKPFPGFGGDSFLTKYGADRDQIITEMFDYIRITNPDDVGLAAANRFGYRAQISTPPGNSQQAGHNQIVPLRIGSGATSTQGFGRFPVLSEVGIGFIATADGDTGQPGGLAGSNTNANKTLGGTLLNAGERRIEAILMLESFLPGQGYPHVIQSFSVRIADLDGMAVRDSTGTWRNLGFPTFDPTNPTNLNLTSPTAMLQFGMHQHSRRWGGSNSMNSFFPWNRLPARGVMAADSGLQAIYPFISIPITVIPGASNQMTFSGATLNIEIYNRSSSTHPGFSPGDIPVSKLRVTLPSVTIPVPKLITTTIAGVPKEGWWSFSRDGAIAGTGGRLSRSGGETTAYSNDNPGRAALFIRQINQTGDFYDVVRSVVPKGSDYRLPMLAGDSVYSDFEKHARYDSTTEGHAHTFVQGGAPSFTPGVRMASSTPTGGTSRNLISGLSYWGQAAPDVAVHSPNSTLYGDFDNGLSTTVDGAYMNLPDVGNVSGTTPYFNMDNYTEIGTSRFSPNRQIPSPGMFGSLPSGAKAGIPWRTLLFRPKQGHPGAIAPHDHLWTDLFWMPVVEPYAISEPFSTAGKVNLNYQIAPFNYIRRATAMIGVLRPETMLCIPDSSSNTTNAYKGTSPLAATTTEFRFSIDAAQTLQQFDDLYAAGDVFRSPSQLMELYLVPQGQTLSNMSTFWDTRRITGDNSRERPYTNILGRVTTKSNTYTVHYRVQALKKVPLGAADVWVEGKDKVTGEYRGATTIERYLNPNDTRIPDYARAYATDPNATVTDLGSFYKWRVVSHRAFAP